MDSSKLKYYKNLLEDMKTSERIFNDREIDELYNLFDEEITRQSVKSEDVAEAIEVLTILSKMWKAIGQPTKEIDLAITALQAYQPKESCDWCDKKYRAMEKCIYEFDDHESVGHCWEDYKPNYCPNCGRKLKENE